MSLKQLILIIAAGGAFTGAVLLIVFAGRQVFRAWRRKHYTKPAPKASGAHEACELTAEQQLVFERYATRYRGLGQDVTRDREGSS